jgi:hypothetical protein
VVSRSDSKAWGPNKSYLSTMPHTNRVCASHDGRVHICIINLAGTTNVDWSGLSAATCKHLSKVQGMMELHGTHTGPRKAKPRSRTAESDIHRLEHLEGKCRRVFDNRAMQAGLLQEVIKGDVQQWELAWRSSPDQAE